MELNFNWINLLILFGAVQGLVFSLILFFNRKHPGARFLGMFMLVLAYNGFETFSWSSGLYLIFFDLFPFILIFGVGPSIYLYLRSLLYPEENISRRQVLMHYAPLIFQFVFRTSTIVIHLLETNKIMSARLTPVLDSFYGLYSEGLSIVVYLVYLAASIMMYRNATMLEPKSIAKVGQPSFRPWIKALLFCIVLLGVAWPLTFLAPLFLDIAPDNQYYPIELGLVLFIYWIAFVGYHRSKVIYLKDTKKTRSLLPDEAATHLAKLRHLMDSEKVYLHPDTNLSGIADRVGVTEKTISTVLNQFDDTNFNDFVNEYRVREVITRFNDSDYEHLTISGIALESGFNSQATFQRAFKKVTGVSPREYLAQLSQKTNNTSQIRI